MECQFCNNDSTDGVCDGCLMLRREALCDLVMFIGDGWDNYIQFDPLVQIKFKEEAEAISSLIHEFYQRIGCL